MPDKTWAQKLRAPFPDAQILYKPRVSCGDCRKAQYRNCARHKVLTPCPKCKQRITEAHVDLDYVGHADVTSRLLEVDPKWYWEPAYRNVDKELLSQALGTGDRDIIHAVMQSFTPLTDRFGGLWIKLVIHDDDGTEITRYGYGDAGDKTGPDAMKEVIGDAIRNAAMRFGVAVDLWSKADQVSDTHPEAAETPPAAKPEAKPAEEPPSKPETATINEKAQVLASLAHEMANKRVSEEELKAAVYEVARGERLLRANVINPYTCEISPLSTVITQARGHLKAELSE